MTMIRAVVFVIVAGIATLVSNLAAATAIAHSTLSFENLSLEPTSGVLTLDGAWLLQVFASANNSLGESDSNFDFSLSPDALSESATVTWADASGTATALGDPPDLDVSGSAASAVDIPGCQSAAAFAEGHGTLSNSFTVSGTGDVSVRLGADISGMLSVFTDSCGLHAFTQTIFTLAIDGGDPLLTGLFDQRALSVGPNSFEQQAFSGVHLSRDVLLTAGVSHFILLQVDSESSAQTIPEPVTGALLLAGLTGWLWTRRRRT